MPKKTKSDAVVRNPAVEALSRQRFGKRMRELRLKREMSASDLGRAAGISRKTMANYEWGHAWPSIPVFIAICRILKAGRVPFASDEAE